MIGPPVQSFRQKRAQALLTGETADQALHDPESGQLGSIFSIIKGTS
jgi:hypothetical protein